MIDLESIEKILKENRDRPDNVYSDQQIQEMAIIINYVLNQLYQIIGARNYSIPNQQVLEGIQTQYVFGFLQAGLKDLNAIERGIKSFRLSPDSIYLPTVGKFISLCVSTDYPNVESAYNEACLNSHPTSDKKWTHLSVKEAAKRIGSHYLSTMPRRDSFKLFEYHYDIVIQQMEKGHLKQEPLKTIDNNKNITCTALVAQNYLANIKRMLS